MSMKDLLSKMTELQGTVESVKTVPVATTGKKLLNESSNTVKESAKPSLKSIFSAMLSEAEQVTIQPAKQNTQVIKQGQKTLGTVENPQLAQQIKQSIGKGEMTLAGDELTEVEDEIDSAEYEADVYDGDDYDHDDGSDQYATELNGLHLGDVVKAYYNGKAVIGKINELYPTNMEVELELTGRNTGKTIVVDVRDIDDDNLNEGLDPAQKQKLKSLIYAYRDATDPFGSEYDLDPSVVIDRIRQEFGDKIADTISQGPSMHFPRPGHVSGVYDPLANKSSPRVTKLGKINRQDAETMKRNIKQQQGMTESKLTEKAVSKSQQQAAGAALAAKRGDAPKSKLKGASKEMAKMPAKELEKFAKTKHKGLPVKKEKTDESSSGVRIVHNKLLGGWFIVRGPHQTPISGKFSSKEEAEKSLKQKEKPTANEAALPTHDGDFGAGLGAGRNSKTLESKKAKPDFLDLDKDGDKKESMKKAAADKKKTVKEGNKNSLPKDIKAEEDKLQSAWLRKTSFTKSELADLKKREEDLKAKKAEWRKTIKEGTNPTEAARLLGKAHAMGKDPFACKYEEGSQEAQAYLDGYKEGLDECYGSGGGMGMQQDIGMMPGMDAMVSMTDTPSPRGGSDFEVDRMDDIGSFGGFDSQSDDTDMMAFEAWDRQLNELLNEGKMKDIDIDMKQMSDAEFKKEHGKSKADMKKDLSSDSKKPVKEGISVSVSKGQQGSPDSVTVSAQDSDADALLAMIKQAGLGLFGGDEPSGYGSPAAAQPVGDIGDHDSMMALIKKMSSTGNDYEDEESMSCDSCDDESDSKALVVGEEQGYDDKEDESLGMRTGKESDKEQSMKDRRDDSYGKFGKRTDEDETEDQMEFEVAESNAPDSDEAETTADENAEAEEDKALAGADSGDEEEIDEGSYSMDEEEELTEWANDAGYTGSENIKDNTFEQDIEFMTRVISGGLNGPKKDQTTLPHTRVKVDESRQAINDWKKLSGIK